MRRYSLTALSIWPLSTNFLAASMTFSLLKATVFYSPLVLRITGTREYALCILERVRPDRRVGQAKARRNPERYPRRRLTSDHVSDPKFGVVRPLTRALRADVRRSRYRSRRG